MDCGHTSCPKNSFTRARRFSSLPLIWPSKAIRRRFGSALNAYCQLERTGDEVELEAWKRAGDIAGSGNAQAPPYCSS